MKVVIGRVGLSCLHRSQLCFSGWREGRMLAALGLVVLWANLWLSSAAEKYSVQEILNEVDRVGHAAVELTDSEMQQDFLLIREKIKKKIERSQLDQDQLVAANELLAFILRKMREGKINLFQIKYFIKFAQSDKLDKLLATWDTNLLKMKPNVG
eukprot:XP_002932254.2 PREDICTED: uncharacterized protein LOC100491090 [Xenopus tropicalis]